MRKFLARIIVNLGVVFLATFLVAQAIAQEKRLYNYPHIGSLSPSPDGRYIAFDLEFPTAEDNQPRLCIVDVLTKEIYEIPQEYLGVIDPNPAWCPDGSVIAFQAGKIYLINPDGTNLRQLTDFVADYPVWSPNGNYLAVETKREGDFESGTDIMIIDRQGNEVAWLVTSSENEHPVAWSPDNFYILFARDVSVGSSSYPDRSLWRANIDLQKPFPAESSGIYRLEEWDECVRSVTITPDSSKILLTGENGGGIWIMNADGSGKTLLIPNSVFPGEFDIDAVAWCPQINKLAVVAMEKVEYNEVEGYDGPDNIYLMNPDGTGLEQITFFTGIPVSQAKAPHFPLITALKGKVGEPVIAKGMKVKANSDEIGTRQDLVEGKGSTISKTVQAKRSVEPKTSGERTKIAKNIPLPPQGSPIREDTPKSSQVPLLAGGLSLSALGYAVWKFLKLLS